MTRGDPPRIPPGGLDVYIDPPPRHDVWTLSTIPLTPPRHLMRGSPSELYLSSTSLYRDLGCMVGV